MTPEHAVCCGDALSGTSDLFSDNDQCCCMQGQHACQWALLTLPPGHALSLCCLAWAYHSVYNTQAASQRQAFLAAYTSVLSVSALFGCWMVCRIVFWMPLLDKHGCHGFLAEHTRLLAAKPYMQILLSVVTHLPVSSCGINSRMNMLHMPELNITLPIWSFVKETSLNSRVKA